MRALIGGFLLGFPTAYWSGPRVLMPKQLAVIYLMGVLFVISHVLWLRGHSMRSVVRQIQRERKQRYQGFDRRARGFMMIDALVSCLVIIAVSTMSAVFIVKVLASQNQTAAKQRVIMVQELEAQEAICASNPNNTACAGLTPLLPTAGTVNQSGYSFTYAPTQWGWHYIATPLSANTGVMSYFTDQSGVVRCGADYRSAPC